jgi:D-specific alpha-keto acid dehydrogenase
MRSEGPENDIQITVFDCGEDERDVFYHYAKSYGVDLNIVDEPISAENVHLACGSRCVSISHKARLCESVLWKLKKGGVECVTTRSIGVDHIDLPAANRLGIRVENSTYSSDGVADYTMMLILMALRNAKDVLGRVEKRDFSLTCTRSPDLREMTVGVIGTGRIGQGVITRLRSFGCPVLACGNEHTAETVYLPFNELIEKCDVLTFHLPLTAQTRHILNRKNIQKVKDGAYIVNTGRGGLIETEARLDALKSNKLRGAALDVLEGEEGIFYHNYHNKRIGNETFLQLCKMPNVIITPHTAFYTQRALLDTVENTILKCLSQFQNRSF